MFQRAVLYILGFFCIEGHFKLSSGWPHTELVPLQDCEAGFAEMKFEQGLMKTSGDALSPFCRLSIHWKIHFSMVKKVPRPTFELGNLTIEELQTLC